MNTSPNKKAKRYNKLKIRIRLIEVVFVVLFLILFQTFFSSALKTFSTSLLSSHYCAFGIYLIVFCLFYYVATSPLHFYSTFILEHRFRLSNQNFFDWFKDDIKGSLLSLTIFLIFAELLYTFLRYFTETWWIWIASFWFLISVVLAKITPIFIVPLFFKYSEVEEKLKRRIFELSKKCKIKVLDVYKIDFSKKTNKFNAAVLGIGKTRRVILADNLINDFTDGEIENVLAHEFAHHKLFHMWKLLGFGVISSFLCFFVLHLALPKITVFLTAENIYDIKIFPALLLVLFVARFLILPLQNGFSRRLERKADIFALEVIRDKVAFISLMQKLAHRNLADPNPPKLIKFLFYDHPPISERICLAENFSNKSL